MARHRTANEKKALDHFLAQIGDFSWNKGTFAAMLAYEHPVLIQKAFDTFYEAIDMLAECYVQGKFTPENADACEKSYVIRDQILKMRDGLI